MLFVLALCRSGARREERREAGEGSDSREQQGLTPATHTSPHHCAPLNTPRRHGEGHLLALLNTQHYLKEMIVHADQCDTRRITVLLFTNLPNRSLIK